MIPGPVSSHTNAAPSSPVKPHGRSSAAFNATTTYVIVTAVTEAPADFHCYICMMLAALLARLWSRAPPAASTKPGVSFQAEIKNTTRVSSDAPSFLHRLLLDWEVSFRSSPGSTVERLRPSELYNSGMGYSLGLILKCSVMRDRTKHCVELVLPVLPTHLEVLDEVVEDTKTLCVLAVVDIGERANLGRLGCQLYGPLF